MKNALSIGAISAFLLPLTSPGHADTVTLGNGDTIEGTVVRDDIEGVEIKHSVLGPLTLSRADVTDVAISSGDPNYTDGGWFFPGWEKSVTAGISGTVADTNTLNFNTSFDTSYADESRRWFVDAFYIYQETESDETANWFSVEVARDWLIAGEAYFYWANGRFQINKQRSYEERTSGSAGVGYEFVNRPDDFALRGRFGAGGVYDAGNINEFTPELQFGLEAEWTLDAKSSLTAFTRFFTSLDPAFSDYRNESGATYNLKIDTARGLSFRAEVLFDLDSKIEGPFEESAVSYLAALVYDF